MPPNIKKYKDVNLSFIPHPVTGDIVPLVEIAAVSRSIRNLILTDNYEIPYNPDKGSGITYLLFEPASSITEQKIKQRITETIVRYEPRADLLNVEVEVKRPENKYEATITFGVVSQIEPITISLFLERVR